MPPPKTKVRNLEQLSGIDFELFVRTLDIYHPKTPNSAKKNILFKAYDFDGDDIIGRWDLICVMKKLIGPEVTQLELQIIADSWLKRAEDLPPVECAPNPGLRRNASQNRGIRSDQFSALIDPVEFSMLMTVCL
mmetsp:Transcript_88015/g.234031  ORF Transcript_88015/g.234031 Transcript_88015/m.234031 type:complete len:134 (+) Transcript_88015:1366-1767(+)|eukprot:CAMPEP_0113714820 /NCGR_PEP_ID=MMETSP0038_2-20120614/32859_1 /TAXON_ID=2898 /ORGANISM="Cryptomonas paramecium" /LENGTH=133 /DNA_ID=CAMNT_0000641899 /DNA_START=102 /DNA_END=503 /DNA_ORIENTATION=- /assembly_acc=CAM_ASM_000170